MSSCLHTNKEWCRFAACCCTVLQQHTRSDKANLLITYLVAGLQKSVLKLYRDFSRAAGTKSPEGKESIMAAVRSGFEVPSHRLIEI